MWKTHRLTKQSLEKRMNSLKNGVKLACLSSSIWPFHATWFRGLLSALPFIWPRTREAMLLFCLYRCGKFAIRFCYDINFKCWLQRCLYLGASAAVAPKPPILRQIWGSASILMTFLVISSEYVAKRCLWSHFAPGSHETLRQRWLAGSTYNLTDFHANTITKKGSLRLEKHSWILGDGFHTILFNVISNSLYCMFYVFRVRCIHIYAFNS